MSSKDKQPQSADTSTWKEDSTNGIRSRTPTTPIKDSTGEGHHQSMISSMSPIDMNTSFMIGDIDLSKLDAKRQHDLAQMVSDKDRLIIENSERHRSILNDYNHLLEEFTMKDIELTRQKQAYDDLRDEVVEYRRGVMTQHEKALIKLKEAEQSNSEFAGALVSAVMYAEGMYTMSLKFIKGLSKKKINFEKEFGVYLRELDKGFKAVMERHKKRPKRLMPMLEEVNNALQHLKSHTQWNNFQNTYDQWESSEKGIESELSSLSEKIDKLTAGQKLMAALSVSQIALKHLPFVLENLQSQGTLTPESTSSFSNQQILAGEDLTTQSAQLSRLYTLQSALDSLNQQTPASQEELSTVLRQQQEIKEKILKEKIVLESIHKQIQEISEQNRDLELKYHSQSLTLADAQRTLSASTAELSQNQSRLAQTQRSLQKERIVLAEKIAKIQRECSELKTSVDGLTADNEDMMAKERALEQRCQQLQAREVEIEKINEELKRQIGTLEKQAALLKEKGDEMERSMQINSDNRLKAEELLKEESARVMDLKRRIALTRGNIGDAENILKDSNSEIARLQLELEFLDQKKELLQTQIDTNKDTAVKLAHSLSEQQSSLSHAVNLVQSKLFGSTTELDNSPQTRMTGTFGFNNPINGLRYPSFCDPLTRIETAQKEIGKSDADIESSQKVVDELQKKLELCQNTLTMREHKLAKMKEQEKALREKTELAESRVDDVDRELQVLTEKVYQNSEIKEPLIGGGQVKVGGEGVNNQGWDIVSFLRLVLAASIPLLVGYILIRSNIL
jgi:chromosome segregation ATPase